jgi:hypothetical protein
VNVKPLYSQAGYTDSMRLERWSAGFGPERRDYPNGAECFVIAGEFRDDTGRFAAGSWLRLPPGDSQRVQTDAGCMLYLKTGGHPCIRESNTYNRSGLP